MSVKNLNVAKLSENFYTRGDVTEIALELLGKYIITNIQGVITSGMIVETEAYSGRNDRACHANNGNRTRRTEVMFEQGGKVYVYLCYGIHNLFNVTTNIEGFADAVLIRAVEPVEGIEWMLERRKMKEVKPNLTAGPGLLTQALGISREHYGESLLGKTIWLENRNKIINKVDVVAAKRIGVEYAKEDALYPWRFFIKNNKWVSRIKIK